MHCLVLSLVVIAIFQLALRIDAQQNISISEGQNAQIRCVPTGASRLHNFHFEIAKDGVVLSKENTFLISKAKLTDTGRYTCTINDPSAPPELSGKETSHVDLIVGTGSVGPQPGTSKLDITPTSRTANQIVLQCSTTLPGNWRYSWTAPDGNKVTGKTLRLIASDNPVAGTYECQARFSNRRLKATYQFDGFGGVEPSRTRPIPQVQVIKIPSSMGDTMILSCTAPLPGGSVVWYSPSGTPLGTDITLTYVIRLQVDVGGYTCSHQYPGSEEVKSTAYELNPRDFRGGDPNVRPSPTDPLTPQITFISYQPIRMRCEITGDTADLRITYQWYDSGRLVSSDQIFEPSTQSDKIYECRITYTNTRTRISGDLKTEYNLQPGGTERSTGLTVGPGPIRYIIQGTNKEMHCELDQTSEPEEFAEWRFYPQTRNTGVISTTSINIRSDGLPRVNVRDALSNSYVTISNIDYNHAGKYECTVLRSGIVLRREAILVVIQPRGKQIEVLPELIEAKSTTRAVEFHCEYDNPAIKPSQHEWTFQSSLPGSRRGRLPPNAGPTPYDSETTSYIRITKPNYRDHDGTYFCKVEEGIEDSGILKIQDQGTGRSLGVLRTDCPNDIMSINAGDTVTVACFDANSQDIPIVWDITDPRRMTVSGPRYRQVLTFRASDDDDGLRLTCRSAEAEDGAVCTLKVRRQGCGRGQRQCNSGECLPESAFCNYIEDCRDASDEYNCERPLQLLIKPSSPITVNVGDTVRVACYERSQLVAPEWRYPEDRRITTNVLDGQTIIEVSNVNERDNSLVLTCHYKGRYDISVRIIVNPSCSFGFKRCQSNECIRESQFCDGRSDCVDGSDESRFHCEKCEPNERACKRWNNMEPIRPCITINWFCDGENDCGNQYDESACPTGSCDITYRCRNGVTTIPNGYVCDKEADCLQRDDEEACARPQIISRNNNLGILPTKVVKRVGETVTFTCEVSGRVIRTAWRYNWGHITSPFLRDDGGRCQSDQNGYTHSITLYNLRKSDEGFYTCEAVNNVGRAFDVDYILEITEDDRFIRDSRDRDRDRNNRERRRNNRRNSRRKHRALAKSLVMF